jgi:hypothetical protein
MTAPECPREQDVIAAIVAGKWPGHCDDALLEHAAQCGVCRELVEVTSLLHVERYALDDEGNIPSAGQVWWRAAIRARLEATQQVARPLSWLFGVSVAFAVGLAVAVVELMWSPVQHAVRSAAPVSWSASFRLAEAITWLPSWSNLTPLATIGGFVLLGAAACLVLAPVALYFALSDE